MSDVGGSVDDSDDNHNHKHKDDRRPARTGVACLASHGAHGVSSGRCSSASIYRSARFLSSSCSSPSVNVSSS